jgi:chorismate dehydratase
MQPVRIACVQYLNTVPLIDGLEGLAGIELIRTVPSRIAGLVEGGGAEIGLVSLIDAGAAGGRLVLLPAGMIGCDGPTLTVRLFSSVPIDRIGAVHADTDSHTSVALCRIVLDRLHGLRPDIIDFDAREGVAVGPGPARAEAFPQTMLLIGDKVVTHAPPGERYPHQLDLGEAWHGLTGLPFVYAVWMCRAGEEDSPAVRAGAAVLDRQLRHNRTRLGWIVAQRAAEHRWPADLAARYLGSLMRYRIGPREREAVARFFGEASRLGLAAPGPAPRWVDAGPPVPAAGA